MVGYNGHRRSRISPQSFVAAEWETCRVGFFNGSNGGRDVLQNSGRIVFVSGRTTIFLEKPETAFVVVLLLVVIVVVLVVP